MTAILTTETPDRYNEKAVGSNRMLSIFGRNMRGLHARGNRFWWLKFVLIGDPGKQINVSLQTLLDKGKYLPAMFQCNGRSF